MNELIVLLAHGSSDEDWSNTFVQMTQPICSSQENVALAFMELSTPLLEDLVKDAAASGYDSVAVLPLFLAKGRHLKQDVPSMLSTYQQRYSINTRLLPPIGEHPKLAEAIHTIIELSLRNED